LQDQETITQIGSVWGYLTLDDVSLDPHADDVAITGYPDALFEATLDRISVKPVTLFAERLTGPPPEQPLQPPVPGLDIYYRHSEQGYLVGVGLSQVPPMEGMSGGSILGASRGPVAILASIEGTKGRRRSIAIRPREVSPMQKLACCRCGLLPDRR